MFLFASRRCKVLCSSITRLSSHITTARFYSRLKVSVLGPPNAGKSTLFNRLLDREANRAYRLAKGGGGMQAIVSSVPGTTRDRRECIGRLANVYFTLYDTAGIDTQRLEDPLKVTQDMVRQSYLAAQQSDLVLLMFDARVGLTSDLQEIARWLRKSSAKRVQILANKMEGQTDDYSWDHLEEVSRLGFGEPMPISAIHGDGMVDLAVLIHEMSQEKNEGATEDVTDNAEDEKPLQLAILGRQNVGKSTLVNALLKENRVLTGSTPGLTRDAISIQWQWKGRPVQLVDTAGIRRKSKRENENDIEDLAVVDAMRAMKVADVAVLVLDTDSRRLMRQELAIADAILKEGRAMVIAANKMDLLIDDEFTPSELEEQIREQLEERFPFLRKTPIVPMSSLNGESVEDLMPVVFEARDRWAQTITTALLNRWIKQVIADKRTPIVDKRPIKIKYAIQTKGRPPTFLLFCNTDNIPDGYLRYLTHHFQDSFEMYGMEVRLVVKKSASDNPYKKKARKGRGIGGKKARKERLYRRLRENAAKNVE